MVRYFHTHIDKFYFRAPETTARYGQRYGYINPRDQFKHTRIYVVIN